ncbi:MAG TPA: translocation/assembly module TamB domain-containing protein [Bauldia sp.]|nr:translocation/assembly module TamB domain-containing protein [Bauldia sp.]
MIRAIRLLLYFIAALVLVVGLVLLFVATPPGRAVVASLVERAAAGSGLSLSIERLSGWPPFSFGAGRIVVADAKGPFAEIEGLSAEVSIRGLLSRTIAFDTLSAGRIAVFREPVLPPDNGDGTGTLLPLVAREISIARLELGQGLIGHSATLGVAGAVATTRDGGIDARVEAKRIDGRLGSLTAVVARSTGDARLVVDATLEEAADGILLGLMGRDRGPAYRLVAKTGLDGGAFDGSLSLTSDGDARFSGEFALTPAANNGHRLTVTGEGDLAELVPPAFADFLSGAIRVSVDAEWARDAGEVLPQVTVHEGRFVSGTIRAEASGAFGGASTDLALRMEAAKPGGGEFVVPLGGESLAFGSLDVSGRIAPAGGVTRLDLIGRTTGLSLDGVSAPAIGFSLAVEADGKNPLADRILPFAFRAEADAVDVAGRTIPGGAATPLVATANGELDLDTMHAEATAALDIAGGRVTYAGTVSAGEVTGRAEAAFADIAQLAGLFEQALRGGISASAEGRFTGREGLSLRVEARGDGLAGGDALVTRLLGPEPRLSATVTDAAEAGIALTDLALEGAQLALTGSASLDGHTVDATVNGRVADLGVVAEGTTGAADVAARVTGEIDAPDVDMTVTVAEGVLLDQPIADASVRLKGAPADGGWQGTLTLGGSLADLPLAGTARVGVARGRVAFPAIDLTVAENRITGALAAAGEGLLSGSLHVEASNLATLAAVALVEATGAASARATFAAEAGRQDLTVSFAGRDVAVESVTAGHVEGTMQIADLFGVPRIGGRADLGSVSVGGLVIDTAMVTAEVSDDATRFTAAAAGPDLTLTGSGSFGGADQGGETLRIDSLEGSAFGFPVDLAEPASILMADGETRVTGVRLAAGGGEVTVDGIISPAFDLRLAANEVDASIVNVFVPDLDADGVISGGATVTGAPDAPAFAWEAAWTDFAVEATESIGLPPLAVTARGEGDRTATSIDAKATGGGLALTVTGAVPLSGDGIELAVAGRSTALDLDHPALARLFSGETTLAAKVTTGQEGRVAFSDVVVEGSGLAATGRLSLEGDAVEGVFDGSIADLSTLAAQSTGAAEFNARIDGTLVRPSVDATVIVADGMILDQKVAGASVRFEAAPTDGGGWDGVLTLAGNFAGHPLNGTARAEVAGSGGLSFPEVNLAVGENRIAGAIERTPAGLLAGSLDVVAPNLTSLGAILLTEATGAAQGRIVFTPDGERQSVSVAFNGNDVAMPSFAVARVDGQVQIENAFGIPMIRGNAEARGIDVAGVRLDTANVTASVEGGLTEFEASAKGPDLTLAGAGTLADEEGAEVIRVMRLSGTAFGFPLNVSAPGTIRLAGGTTTISGVNLSLGGGNVTVSGSVGSEIDLEIAVNNVSGAFADRFSPGLGAQGTISGSLTATGTPASPRIVWQVNWAGFSVAAMRNAGVPSLALDASGAGTSRATTIEAGLGGSGVALTVTGTVPFSGAGLNVRAQGTAPLGIIPMESGDVAVAGQVRLDLAVTGSTRRPSVNGTFDLVEARVAHASNGIGVAAINGRIRFDGQTARIERLAGRLTQGGDLTIAGSLRVDPMAGFPADLTIRVRNGRYLDGEMVNANFSADLTLTGPATGGGTIAGRVDLGRTQILLPDSFGGGPPIAVEHVHTAPGFVPPMSILHRPGAPPPRGGGRSGGFNLDITVTSTNVIYVRGFGLDAEMGGSLRIAGTTGNPQPVGAFQMRRGRIQVLGRRFDFSRGTLTFEGDLDPVLDFEATTVAPQITATVHVTGPANDPDISLTSSPSLPEEEIISRLLFGKSIGSLSAFQVIRLVDAVAEFSGAYGRDGGLFARVRRTVGLDDLDIDQNAEGGTTVTLGKQLTDNVRVGVQTETDGTSRVTLDVDLTKNLKAQIEGAANGEGSVGLTYEKEY